jgi:hypothetical protein
MKRFPYSICVAVLLMSMLLGSTAAVKSAAAADQPVGYGGAMVQLAPLMAPYRSGNRVLYHVVTLRLILDVGVNERPACFMAPVVHEKFLQYFYKNMLSPSDVVGQRRDVTEKALLDVATAATARGFYSAVRVVDESSPPLMSDPKSQTLSTQCR